MSPDVILCENMLPTKANLGSNSKAFWHVKIVAHHVELGVFQTIITAYAWRHDMLVFSCLDYLYRRLEFFQAQADFNLPCRIVAMY